MRILYVTTISGTMGFFKKEFLHLQKSGNTIDLACNCNDKYELDFDTSNMKIYNIPFSRSPYSKSNIKAYKQLKRVVESSHYDIVHCHTPIAAVVTRLACRNIQDTRVIYTAHGFHFFKGAPFINWLIFFPLEWMCSFWTDCLITINTEDYALARKRMHAKKIEYVPGVGIDTGKFSETNVSKENKCAELQIPHNSIILLSIGELNDNKNHETVIKAISGMNIYYLIAGIGDKKQQLEDISKEVGMVDRVKLLGFRRDIPELLAISDIFVFPSFREGLSVSLMETMASGKPAAVSRIRGNIDLIDDQGGVLFDPHNIDDCRASIKKLLHADLRKLGEHNKEKIKAFDSQNIIDRIDSIYQNYA